MEQLKAIKWSAIPKAVWLAGGFLLSEAALMVLVYYWRVFYYLDARSFPNALLSGCVLGFGAVVYGLCLALARVKNLPVKAAIAAFAVGLIFVFANPPLQVPDEQVHFLRAYAISEGHFDFDQSRAYPETIDLFIASFPGAWVNANTSQGMRENDGGEEEAYSSAGYALKQYGEDGSVLGVADAFAAYFAGDTTDLSAVEEPLSFTIFPYLPAALGMAIARLFGAGALGCFYAGRIANLACYALLCYAALKNCKRFGAVFLILMFLPMSLYMAASLNYDALLLGFYWYALSFLCKDWAPDKTLSKRDLLCFFAVFVGMNIIKPWISLLFLAVPFLLPATAWVGQKCKKWQYALGCMGGALGVTGFVTWYGNAFRSNYAPVERMLGSTVNGGEQLVFVLSNPLRYIAVMVGTLYENDFFVGQLGLFGSLDLPISLINMVSPLMLLLGAVLAANHKNTLRPLPAAGLGLLSVCYIGGVLTALYLTYTPVGMVRIIGLQARYFLPVFAMLGILLAAGLGKLLRPTGSEETAHAVAFWSAAAFGLVGGVLLFQHYFIGPVYTI
ncbi:MAG: DUF2142 domain-containing protein [Faecalibacterium sp.]